ncbi:MAG: diphthine--ammonia ligase [Verrucomicrobia bacterium]|nr:diphthine--ammonia ligase [Cytophagales bacterium]
MKPVVMHWSGGKDSVLALYRLLTSQEYDLRYLLTTINQPLKRVSMHGVRLELLEKQAQMLQIPLKTIGLSETISMAGYSLTMQQAMENLKKEGINYAAFGDIFLEDLKTYRQSQLEKVPMQGVFPLWGEKSEKLIDEFIDSGFKAVIVCVNEKYLDKSFAGRLLDRDFIKDLPKNVDVCGENGEYHSFVFDAPIFDKPIDFEFGETVYRNYKPVSSKKQDNCHSNAQAMNWDTGFWYQDLLPIANIV